MKKQKVGWTNRELKTIIDTDHVLYPQGIVESDEHRQEAAPVNSNLEKEVNSLSKTDATVEYGGGNQVRCLFVINLQQRRLGTHWNVK